MNRLKKTYLLSGLCIVLNVFIAAGQGIQFHYYGVAEGISQSEILCIFQDSEGYMWFGTQNGLNKFDGYSFENYFHNPSDTNTISNSWIFDITEDITGDIWLGTKGGINRLDKKTGLFTTFRLPGNISENSSDFIYGITTDSLNIYVNQSPVLTVIDIQTGSSTSFTNDFEQEQALYDVGLPIIRDREGILWMGSFHGLSSFDPETREFEYYIHSDSDPGTLSHNHISALYEDRHGNILIGTENGLNFLDKKTNKVSRFDEADGRHGILSDGFIQTITQDHSGNVWIGTQISGLYKLIYEGSPGFAEVIHYRSGFNRTNFISSDNVHSLYQDRSNNLWIGTISGVSRTDLKRKSIRTYMKSDNPGSVDLLDNVIASVYMDREGKLWIGNWGKGLNILDRSNNEVIHYTADLLGERHIPQNHAHLIFEDSKSRIWLGTRNGVSIFDNKRKLFVPVEEYFNAPGFNYFNNNRVYSMIEDSGGRIWIGTGNGIAILNPETKGSTLFHSGEESSLAIRSNLVYSMLEDRDQYIWIATANGLNRYDPRENSMSHFVHHPDSSNTLCDNYTISLCEDRNGNIWIGTSSGANRLNKAEMEFTCYNTTDGLPSNIIYDIIEDGNGNLWFSTGKGLAMKNPDETARESFLVEEELLGKEFNLKAVFKADDGEMFFGGIDGLVSFYPDSLTDNNHIPQVRITSVEKETDGIKHELNPYSDRIRLSYEDYSFSIEFSALEYTDPSKNRYEYQMEGISENWIDIAHRRSVQFTKLPPGEYTFRVKGSNNDGIWNHTGASMDITILPPWWRSKYAIIFYIVFTIATIIAVIRIREMNLVREKKILEVKIRERTAEIAEQKERAEESEAKLSSTVSSIDDLVFVLDCEGLIKEFYNPGKDTTVYSEAESYIERHYENVGFPDLVVLKLKKAFGDLNQKESLEEFDYSIEKDEQLFWFNAKMSPRRNATGELFGITIVARDITGRKRSEEQLKELNATKDTFFSILAHDLKNPFSSLHSMSEMMMKNYQNLEEAEKLQMLKNMHNSAEQIFNLLENLLTWSSSQRGRIEYTPGKFNLSTLVQVNMNLHKIPAEKKGVSLTSDIADNLAAHGDREMINTVIRNLINNAVKFSHEGGTVEIEILDKDNFFEVIVVDHGVGIPSGDVKKLFRIDEKYKSRGTAGESGTGLGLVLCKEFVEKNGGEIWCHTEEGSGAEFHFTIPRYMG